MTNPLNQTLGGRLRSFRKAQNLTQQGLAKALGMHFQSILRYERDKMRPDADMILKLRELFQLNPNWLLLGQEPQFLPKAAPKETVTYESGPYFTLKTKEPYVDYRAVPPPNSLVETAEVPVLKTLQALLQIPLERDAAERTLLLPKAWLMHPQETCVAAVKTDSLRSMLRLGDLIALDWSDRGGVFAEGSIVAVKRRHQVHLKRFALAPTCYYLEDDDSERPWMVPKEEGSPVLARCLFVLRKT